jgi:hypothetical protein
MAMQDLEQVPVAPQHLHEEEANPAVADAKRVGRPVIDVSPVQEVGFQLGLGDLGRGLAAKVHQLAQRPGVCFLGALALAVELQCVDRLLIPALAHDRSPG